jgi:ribosomal peptide maturation radical SAM protein 1
MAGTSISLVCMPWHLVGSPSIQLGTLEAVLARAGIACRSHSLHLELARFLAERREECRGFDLADYGEVATRWMNLGAGEWVFALSPVRRESPERDAALLDLWRANGMPAELSRRLERLRARVPAFLERCADEILAGEPAVVGFTAVYSQTLPSLALAHVLKQRDPCHSILFGGASCEGPMGPALLEAFADVDAVVRGEAEGVIAELVRALEGGATPPCLPGLCRRDQGRVVAFEADERARVALDDVPPPVFDEYFERLERGGLSELVLPEIPFETARGCWWGAKAHCTFCGLNGTEMAFRSKSPERVLEELAGLAERHGVLDFTATDNILDLRYFETLLPELARRRNDFSLFFETKANLREAHVRALRAAGARAIQPGIESLSTPTLELMRKGVSALQNLRLLKWCAKHGVRAIWNLLYGFPGEDPAEYARMAELVPALVHLEPPTLGPLMVYRFSPYHARPAEHGLVVGAPLPAYRLLYDAGDACLRDLAQAFEHSYADGRDPETYVGPLRAEVERWNRERERNRGALSYRRGPGFVVVTDTRTTSPAPARFTLTGDEARAFLACEAGATPAAILREGIEMSEASLRGLLSDLVSERLLYEERGRYLSLALSRNDAA